MRTVDGQKTKRLIRNLLLVLILGAASAVILALAALYFFGFSGNYSAANIILNPDTAFNLSYNEVSSQTRKSVPFAFDKIEFLFYDRNSREWHHIIIDKKTYTQFFALVSGDRSLNPVPEPVVELFGKESPSMLSINVKENGQSVTHFQQIQFVNDADYYRVQMRDNSPNINWIYFFHENVFQNAMKILEPKNG